MISECSSSSLRRRALVASSTFSWASSRDAAVTASNSFFIWVRIAHLEPSRPALLTGQPQFVFDFVDLVLEDARGCPGALGVIELLARRGKAFLQAGHFGIDLRGGRLDLHGR